MIIALDYDKTYTADIRLFKDFIDLAIDSGHSVICLTMRYPTEPINDMPKGIKIYYTSRKAKKKWADENGIVVDIWIDDKPAWLFEDALGAV